MMPFIHIGSWTLATYGMLIAFGFFVGFYLFAAELRRRDLTRVRPIVVTAVLCIAGIVFSKLYTILEEPARFAAHPATLLTRASFTFYGGALGDFLALAVLARHYRTPMACLLDALAAPLALGYAIGRMACFVSGDGDYGIPTTLPWGMSFPNGLVPTIQPVHPTPLYEAAVSSALALLLWRLGAPRRGYPPFYVFSIYLVLSGAARFSVEFIKRNPEVVLGLVNAQLIAAVSIITGLVGWWRTRIGPQSVRTRTP
jgi:phosphatidylglycerol---prolipoprotein diacylglyceryl transferase